MKKWTLTLFCVLATIGIGRAQELFVGGDLTTRFDNREYSGCTIDDSRTYFSLRLTPCVGIDWAEYNRVVVAVDLWQDFGEDAGFFTRVKPQIYYQFQSRKAAAAAGIFPRTLLAGDYGEPFFDSAYAFYNNRIQGMMGRYEGANRSFVELAIDWVGARSTERREEFLLLSAGEWRGAKWYGGYTLTLQHYAKTTAPAPGEGVVDNMLINPYVGVRLCGQWEFNARLGYLQSLQRDRILDAGWETPKGGQLTLSIGRWGLTLANTLYIGENLLPFWDKYGFDLYSTSTFYGTVDGIYNRTELSYARHFFRDTLGVEAGFIFHYDGQKLGLQQMVRLTVRLQKSVWRGKSE